MRAYPLSTRQQSWRVDGLVACQIFGCWPGYDPYRIDNHMLLLRLPSRDRASYQHFYQRRHVVTPALGRPVAGSAAILSAAPFSDQRQLPPSFPRRSPAKPASPAYGRNGRRTQRAAHSSASQVRPWRASSARHCPRSDRRGSAVAQRQRSKWPTVSSVSGGGGAAQPAGSTAPAIVVSGFIAARCSASAAGSIEGVGGRLAASPSSSMLHRPVARPAARQALRAPGRLVEAPAATGGYPACRGPVGGGWPGSAKSRLRQDENTPASRHRR